MIGAHENFSRGDLVQGSSDRSFGFVFVAVFVVVALLPLRQHHPIRYWALAVAAALLIISVTIPRILHPANILWTRFALLLNKFVSPVAMGAIFFLVASPTGFLMRLVGKDPLRLRFDPAASSYWQVRTPRGPSSKSMERQF